MTPYQLPAQILAATITLAALPATVGASDNADSHQHGHAQLQAAISGNQIDLIFTSPAYNLLGFEHEARTGKQKAHAKETSAWLRATPLVNTPESGCTVQNADVHSGSGAEDNDHHDHGHDHDEEPAGHSDIEVTQTLACSGLADSTALTTPLTSRFPELETLSVEWVWSKGQGSGRLVQGDSSFRLDRQ